MDKAHPLSTPIVEWSSDVEKDQFHPKEDDKAILGLVVLYLSIIGRGVRGTNFADFNPYMIHDFVDYKFSI